MSERPDGITIRCPFCALPADLPADAGELSPGTFLVCAECEGLCCTTPDGDLRRPTSLELEGVDWGRFGKTVAKIREKKQGIAHEQ